MRRIVIVLAGTFEQFRLFLESIPREPSLERFQGVPRSDFIYANRIDNIRGVLAATVVHVGTFWDRTDAFELDEYARSRIR